MILGRNAIVLDVEEARKLASLVRHVPKKQLEYLQKQGVLQILDDLRSAVRDIDDQ